MNICIGGGFKYFAVSTICFWDFYFDEHFSNRLKPPSYVASTGQNFESLISCSLLAAH